MSASKRKWWEKPGFGLMYQIEARPGWLWNRNYDKFNASMKDKNGNLKFNGPYCKMKEWVEFSKALGVDYHIFEAKWHDGICYFDSKYTNWKTPTDYCKIYADESKKARIPFMFYYSNIFDHNPQFNDIQPLRSCTPSFIAMHAKVKKFISHFSRAFAILAWMRYFSHRIMKKLPQQEKKAKYLDDIRLNNFSYDPRKYEKYVLKQLTELVKNYNPDGLWMDWYQMHMEASADIVMDFMKEKYPDVILTFNNSIMWNLKWAHYLCFEAHNVKAAWQRACRYRKLKKPWELICPAANYWDNPAPRADSLEVARMAAIIMANGGKAAFGLPSRMDGSLFPIPAKHLKLFGEWYKKRRKLFTDAVPMRYRGKKAKGININEKHFGLIVSIFNNDYLIHLINFRGIAKSIRLHLSKKKWSGIERIVLEPHEIDLRYIKNEKKIVLSLEKEIIDKIDTIIRIIMSKK